MRRAGVIAAVLACAAAVGLALWMWSGIGVQDAGGVRAEPGPPASLPAGDPTRPADAFPLTVRYVYDGDTVEAQPAASDGAVTTADPIRVRLIGVDTPEGTPRRQCWADEARADLREMLPAGSTVWAAPDSESRDAYGRWLLHLWTGDGRFVAAELVRAGDAEALRVWPNVAHADLLASLETHAQAAGAGRWSACG